MMTENCSVFLSSRSEGIGTVGPVESGESGTSRTNR